MYDIAAIGELLVDFTSIGTSSDGQPAYSQNAGGAPANVVCMAAKLGAKTAFIGKIGNDMFGSYLKGVLNENKVDTRGLILDKNFSTTLAFVKNDTEGDREFVFYRNGKISADLNLSYSDIDLKVIDECKVFHFGALSLTAEPSRSATVNAVEYAKQNGKIISYDPNWRPLLWPSKTEGEKYMRSVIRYADIIKVSEAELQLLTDCGTLIAAAAKLFSQGVKIVCITQGAKGCIIASRIGIQRFPSFKTDTVDTLGAGDCFLGAFLYKFLEIGKTFDELEGADIESMAMFANACGALSASKKGAIPSMPSLSDIRTKMEEKSQML
ncbi:MAG: carbohydrate kinase [Huintestinicola sp.]